jgi:hypothetical protein
MSTDEYERWKALEVRRPDDIRTSPGGPVPLRWQAERHGAHTDRLMNADLPADFPYAVERGDAGDALACLALGESMRRDLKAQRSSQIRKALAMGATWSQVAAALDVTPDEARALLQSWADGQRNLWLGYEAEGVEPLGLDADDYAAVAALCNLADDQAATAAT